jgi:cell division protein FtsX
MKFETLLEGIIFSVVGAVVLFALFPAILSSASVVTQNATYVKDFPQTISLLVILPLIIAVILILLFVKLFKAE